MMLFDHRQAVYQAHRRKDTHDITSESTPA